MSQTPNAMRPLACTLLACCTFFTTAAAQIGFSGAFVHGQAPDWVTTLDGSDGEPLLELPGSGWQVGIDYWFRLKNTRIEFLPTLAYSRQAVSGTIFGGEEGELVAQAGHFFFNTNIYLFDLRGDCDCPTFSKQGPTLTKGFFLQLSPGISLFDLTNAREESDTDLAPSIGIGIGFDIGLSDLVTLTPTLSARYYPEAYWPALEGPLPELYDGLQPASTLWQYGAGLRLGLRFDQ